MHPLLCRGCRYDLSGLPPKGQCPECGGEYDIRQRRGILRQESASSRGHRLFRRTIAIILLLLGLAIIGISLYFHFWEKQKKALPIGGFVGFCVLLGAAIAYMGEKGE